MPVKARCYPLHPPFPASSERPVLYLLRGQLPLLTAAPLFIHQISLICPPDHKHPVSMGPWLMPGVLDESIPTVEDVV